MVFKILCWYFFLFTLFSWIDFNFTSTTNGRLAVLVLFVVGNVFDAHSTAFLLNRDINGYCEESSFLIRHSIEKWGTVKGIVIPKLLILPFCFLIYLSPNAGLALVCILFWAAIHNYRLYFKHYGRP